MSRIAIALLTAAALAAPAMAQSADTNFNGPFIGAQLGWQQDRQSLTTGTVPPITTRARGDGFAYGGQLGYDFNLGSAVLGVEASLTGRTGSNRFPTFDLEAGRTINVTARAGWLVTPEGLLYARGGYSNARYTVANNVLRLADVSENRDGYTVGAGYEHMLAKNVSARIEYNYSDFGNDSLPGIGGPATLNYHRHAVMTGVNFRF
ncbi:outer membrane beta-barrel protein [Sandarakinorhabdus sp. AAP62]|uniref:outer membrane protein n=1 Tax=Sandarakinorhabdus sp. AAP62 TaxID=1248916 RepID=UPI0002DB10D8|nr:outer membrane beta-barrel protein [Sandarakinorhabdus sp. AAP62]